jgi:hypothetical protein
MNISLRAQVADAASLRGSVVSFGKPKRLLSD